MKTVSKSIGLRRLLKLTAVLRTVPKDKFQFGTFLSNYPYGSEEKNLTNLCGTTGCAVGWMPSIPFFRRLGCRYNNQGIVLIQNGQSITSPYYPLDVAKIIFGLTDDGARYLFCPYTSGSPLRSNSTANEVADHIEKFVSDSKQYLA